MTIRWFLSRTVRQLSEMSRQLQRVLNEQRDLLSAEAIAALQAARAEAQAAIRAGAKGPELKAQMARLEEAARKWLRPYPNPGVRENVKEFLVAVVTILAFTTFFLQLTKIPTGSMQPTLYGITDQDLRGEHQVILKGGNSLYGDVVSRSAEQLVLEDANGQQRVIPATAVQEVKSGGFQVPPLWKRLVLYWTLGISYKHVVAPEDGRVTDVREPQFVLPFVKKQRIYFNGKPLTVWFPGDDLVRRANLSPGKTYRKGEDIIKLKLVAGDHLLVDRFTYNFRQPERGEIIVFKTKGIQGLPADVLYIKRLVALPNEKVQIGNDRHLIINGTRLDASTPRFEMVYSFEIDPVNNPYLGHVNEYSQRQMGLGGTSLAPLFPDERTVRQLGPNEYLAMGDNTLNSSDSRTWGTVPQRNVIGKCWFVYWPFTDRFGWGYR